MAKFYQHPASGNAFGVAACLDVSGYEHEKVFTDIMKGEQMTPEFIAMNPYHQIPTLQTASGFSMWEGNSIMRYVAGQSKPELLGAGAEQQAMVNVCLDSSMGGFYKDGAVALAYPVFGFAKASEEPVEERQEKFKKHMDVFFESGKFVKDGSFMCGDSLTIADFRMWALITFMNEAKCFPFDEKCMAYIAKVEAAMGEGPTANKATLVGMAASILSKSE
jgi:glutathione S-transferase